MAHQEEVILNNIVDLRERLKETLKLALQNRIDRHQIKSITTTSQLMLKSCAVEMDYAKLNRTTCTIEFLERDAAVTV